MLKKITTSLIIISIVLSQNIIAQTIRGKVFDANNHLPLVGVNVYQNDGEVGTTTDSQGFFELENSTLDTPLIVSFVGYQQLVISVNGTEQFLNIALTVDPYQLNEVVIAADQSEQKLLKVPASVAVISEQALRRDNEAFITPALNRVPGVYMHNGTFNTNRITIRGVGSRSLFSTNKVRAYLNEIPLTTGEGETTIEDIDLSFVDRVEVIKGPASSLYGAGLGGTINLIAKKANYRQTAIQNQFTVGSYGLLRNTLGLQSGTDKLNLNLSYNTMHSDGFRDNNEFDRQSFLVMGQVYASKNTTLSFLGNLVDLKAFIPSSINQETFETNPSAAAFTWGRSRGFEDYQRGILGFTLEHHFTSKFKQTSSIFTNFRNAEEQRPFNILREGTQTYGLRSKWQYAPEWGKITLGGEYFNEWYVWRTFENEERTAGAILSDNEERRKYFNIFGQVDWHISPKTLLVAGFNLNGTDYQYTDLFVSNGNQSGEYGFDEIFSPRLALSHQLTEQNAIYGNASHGFSPPTLSETLTPDGSINPDIQPETGWNFELGSRGTVFNQNLSYDISVYTMQINDLLVARRTAEDAFVGINAGKTEHTGFELSTNYQLIRSEEKVVTNLQIWTTYTFTDYNFEDFVDGENDFSENPLTGVAPHLLNAGIDLETQWGLYGNLNYQFVDQIPMRDDNSISSDAYQVVNLKIGFQKEIGKHFSFDLNGGIQNLLDEKYAAMVLVNASSFGGNPPRYFYPGMPRNFYGGVKLGYRFK